MTNCFKHRKVRGMHAKTLCVTSSSPKSFNHRKVRGMHGFIYRNYKGFLKVSITVRGVGCMGNVMALYISYP